MSEPLATVEEQVQVDAVQDVTEVEDRQPSVTVEDVLGLAQSAETQDVQTPEAPADETVAKPEDNPVFKQSEIDAAFRARLNSEREKTKPQLDFARAVLEATGEKDVAKAQERIMTMVAAAKAQERGTKPDSELELIQLRQRLAQLEGPSVQAPTVEPAQVNEDAQEWARRTLDEVQKIGKANGDAKFFDEARTQGNMVNKLLLKGFTPQEAYTMTRGTSVQAKPPSAPPPKSAPTGARTKGTVDFSTMSLEDFKKIDDRLASGYKVRI